MNLLMSFRTLSESSRPWFGCWTLKSLACCAMLSLLLTAGNSVAQTVTVHSDVVGQTPSVIGLNSGNWIPGANTISYWRWSGVNGARIFTSAPSIEQNDDIPGNGDGVNSEISFILRRTRVRANPTSPSLINFAEFENGYQDSTTNFIDYNLAYGTLSSNGIRPLAIILLRASLLLGKQLRCRAVQHVQRTGSLEPRC